MKTPKRPNPEYTAGWRAFRQSIKRHLKSRAALLDPTNGEHRMARGEILGAVRWIDAAPKRAAKKPGGAGRS